MAPAGDLAFTLGHYEMGSDRKGAYATVWALQPDGTWKPIFDVAAPE